MKHTSALTIQRVNTAEDPKEEVITTESWRDWLSPNASDKDIERGGTSKRDAYAEIGNVKIDIHERNCNHKDLDPVSFRFWVRVYGLMGYRKFGITIFCNEAWKSYIFTVQRMSLFCLSRWCFLDLLHQVITWRDVGYKRCQQERGRCSTNSWRKSWKELVKIEGECWWLKGGVGTGEGWIGWFERYVSLSSVWFHTGWSLRTLLFRLLHSTPVHLEPV